MDKIIPLDVTVINGEVQEFPVRFNFRCNGIVPLEKPIDIVRYFDNALCQVAKRMFLFSYDQNIFGTTQFKSLSDFRTWESANCGENTIAILLNGCNMMVNGKPIIINA